MAAYQTVTVTWYRTKGVGQQQTQRLPNAAWSHWQMSVWCVRTEAKVALRDYWGSKFTCSDGAAVPTPTSPAHSGRIRALIKATSAPAGDVSQSHRGAGGAFSSAPTKLWWICHIPEIHAGEGERYFSHPGTKPRSVGLWLTHTEEKQLSNHNNNLHHPAVSTVATNPGSSPN